MLRASHVIWVLDRYIMKQRPSLFILCLLVCLSLLYACATDHPVWQGFQGTPMQGLRAYTAQLRLNDLRDGTELGTGMLFVAHGKLRYEMNGSGPLDQMVLLAQLDSGYAWLINPANNRCLEGSFAPRRWMDIGYLLEAFPKITHFGIISSSEELLGREKLYDYKTVKVRRTGRVALFGEERDFSELFWLAEEFCIPMRHERDMIRAELTNIRVTASADSLFTLPAESRKVASFAELLK